MTCIFFSITKKLNKITCAYYFCVHFNTLNRKKNDKTQNEKLNNTSIRVNAFSSSKIIFSNNSKFIEQWLISLSSIQCISNASNIFIKILKFLYQNRSLELIYYSLIRRNVQFSSPSTN